MLVLYCKITPKSVDKTGYGFKNMYIAVRFFFKMKYLIIMLLFVLNCTAAKVDIWDIYSESMEKSLKIVIVVPDSYYQNTKKYPTLTLLHGAFGQYDDWLKKTPNSNLIQELSDQYNMIVILPEGETFSFYIDSKINNKSQFHTFINQEILHFTDDKYRTTRSNSGRAITGLSMGGHGALYAVINNPELYSAAGSMSGAVDVSILNDRSTAPEFQKLSQLIFGEQQEDINIFLPYSVLYNSEKLKNQNIALILDCGLQDFLLESNRALHRQLIEFNISHDYIERPGGHDWDYWQNAIKYQMLYFYNVFQNNLTAVQN